MLKLVVFLLRMARQINFSYLSVVAALVAGLLSGIGYALLVVLINSALAHRRATPLLAGFIALGVLVSLTRLLSQGLFDQTGTRATFGVRLQLCRNILASPLEKLEEIGPHRLLASLSDDVTALSNALMQLPRLIMNVVIAMACLVYLGWLSWPLLLGTLGFMAVGIISHQLPMQRAIHYLRRLREEQDVLFSHLRALIYGTKELKLHRRRRQILFREELVPTGESIRHFTFIGNAIFAATAGWGNLLFFLVVGALLFGLGPGRIGQPVLTGYVLVLLYMMPPLEMILFTLPHFGRASAALNKLYKLGIDLTASVEPTAASPGFNPRWRSLDLVDVTYSYRGEDDESFRIGPINLAFTSGELVFFIGGNGSGKTTLAKVLTGLYPVEQGEIRLDGRPVTLVSLDDYRQMFSAVFSDFHLFKSLIAADGVSLDESAAVYLERLQLAGKVRVEDGRLSTVDLSQSQRKRLALLNVYLEDRPCYFFDEWAADQDPQYKAVFYFEILPELKARGKTVFVISHDDAYYEVADRLIKLNEGRVEMETSRAPERSAGAL